MSQIHISQHLIVFLFALSIVVLKYIVNFWVLVAYFLLYCIKANKNLHDFFVFIAVKILFLQNLCDKLVDMPLPYLFFEVAKFIIHCILRQILIFLQPRHNRTERILLIMQIFPKINHFILKFNYPFTIKPLIFKPHLLLHKKQGIDRLVFFVVLFQFL